MKLGELRDREGWTKAKLAEIVGVDEQIISNIESGEPIDWAFAASIIIKVRNYLGNKAIEGLDIPQKRD